VAWKEDDMSTEIALMHMPLTEVLALVNARDDVRALASYEDEDAVASAPTQGPCGTLPCPTTRKQVPRP
jgi:hypothetical protein